jgi:signal transduction histidine kinase
VLREGGRPGDETRAPQPRVEQIADLVAEVSATGLDVSLSRQGAERELPAGVQLALYRIAQEALTNVLKHARDVRAVQITLDYADDGVGLVVSDDGGAGRAPSDGGGHGVRGMRERVGLHGGTLSAGRRPGGGWEVRAWLPAAPTPTAIPR